MEHGVARLNDSALGDIDQLDAHEVQKSVRNVGGALRKHVQGVRDAQSKPRR